MSEINLKPEEVADALRKLLDVANDGSAATTKSFVANHERLAKALDEGVRHLLATLDEVDPRMRRLQELARTTQAETEALTEAVAARDRKPRVEESQRLLYGRAVTSEGEPAAGHSVSIHRGSKRSPAPLAVAKTGADGDFAIVLNEEQATALARGFVLAVDNPRGDAVSEFQDVLDVHGASAHYFEVELVEPMQQPRPPGGGRRTPLNPDRPSRTPRREPPPQ